VSDTDTIDALSTTTRSRAKVRERREDVASRALRATQELLADGTPYTELAMQDVAKHAGVARSTLYLQFADKSQLLIAVAEQATAGIFETALDWWHADHSDGIDGLIAAQRQMIGEFREHLHVLLALSEVATYDRDVAAYWLGRVMGFIGTVQSRLEHEQRAGTVDPGMDPATTAQLLTWMVERTISVHCRFDSGDGDERLAQNLARSIWLTVYGAR
jgi:TetR/AcrR family transcriptional regulator, ethionamide resistance regulator